MGLVQYESSDEDEEAQTPVAPQNPQKPPVEPPSVDVGSASEPSTAPAHAIPSEPPQNAPLPPRTTLGPGPQLGPVLGPTRPPPRTTTTQTDTQHTADQEIDLTFLDLQEDQDEALSTNPNPPPSPYTQTRTLIHNLTLPAHPNMDIPPSPPGTPPPGHDALTTKFSTFLHLKRTQGVHFNERLAASPGLKNPSICDKLLGFVGFETEFPSSSSSSSEEATTTTAARGDHRGGDGSEGPMIDRAVEQYGTGLGADVWDGGVRFPPWAYRGPLRRAQERGARERERGRGEVVEFVKASGGTPGGGGYGGGGVGSRAGTPGLGSGPGKRKGRWDT
ncbi:hypothetical protein N658DRAFT_522437 [Parathielavia hyrcaniae]|uniref:HCNGP-like protein n=1 Tax=Parathielavia hyrcaniae TaxID=113614 RepID=A0AAN6T2T7_9PEZI|nr:hypothetical protein N658DRAFT_522437 [Parathielavia hyrcaniae]